MSDLSENRKDFLDIARELSSGDGSIDSATPEAATPVLERQNATPVSLDTNRANTNTRKRKKRESDEESKGSGDGALQEAKKRRRVSNTKKSPASGQTPPAGGVEMIDTRSEETKGGECCREGDGMELPQEGCQLDGGRAARAGQDIQQERSDQRLGGDLNGGTNSNTSIVQPDLFQCSTPPILQPAPIAAAVSIRQRIFERIVVRRSAKTFAADGQRTAGNRDGDEVFDGDVESNGERFSQTSVRGGRVEAAAGGDGAISRAGGLEEVACVEPHLQPAGEEQGDAAKSDGGVNVVQPTAVAAPLAPAATPVDDADDAGRGGDGQQ